MSSNSSLEMPTPRNGDPRAPGDLSVSTDSRIAPPPVDQEPKLRYVVSSVEIFNYYTAHASKSAVSQDILNSFTWYIHYPILADILPEPLDDPQSTIFTSRLAQNHLKKIASLHSHLFPSGDLHLYQDPEFIGDFSDRGSGGGYCAPYAQGFVAAEHASSCIVVTFAGIRFPRQYIHMVKTKPFRIPWAQDSLLEAHEGFVMLYAAVQSRMRKHLKAAMDKFPGFKVVFSGYSQGAALATLAVLDLAINEEDTGVPLLDEKCDLTFYAYSSPRILSRHAAEWLTRLFNDRVKWRLYRLTREQDVVPLMPPVWLGYRHIGDRVYGIVGEGIERDGPEDLGVKGLTRKVLVVTDETEREGNVFSSEGSMDKWWKMLCGLVRSGRYHTEY